MIYYKTVEVPATTNRVVDHRTCDVCNRKIDPGSYCADEAEITCNVGTSYPEGGSGYKLKLDICVECFEDRLVPLVAEHLGAKMNRTEWDW